MILESVYFILVLIGSAFLIKLIISKKQKCILPQPGRDYDDTYCVFTLHQLNLLIVSVIILITKRLFMLILLILNDTIHIDKDCKLIYSISNHVYSIFMNLHTMCINFILTMVILEWIFTAYIIKTQQ